MKEQLKGFVDLTRLQFGFAWPLLFCSGLLLAFWQYGGFDEVVLLKGIAIGFFGFEAGLILNDYVDREYDKRDVDEDLTNYWRAFKERPIPSGAISSRGALLLFFLFAGIAVALIATLPYPHSLYLLAILAYAYCVEVFYQIKKRKQKYPVAQLVGRTDFAMFPVAGYLMVGSPDLIALLYFLFFYPFAMAHLGANDLVDFKNDIARRMQTVTVLYGLTGTARWVLAFTLAHVCMALLFAYYLGWQALVGFAIGFLLLGIANYFIMKRKTPAIGLKVLPMFHVTMIVYSITLIAFAALSITF
ncbi:MAG: UbiA family prenyltransferase [Methanomassiliicoccales archaeon]|nr:UbiA family prenyltransferase [Methanomassiliicoccales archaeon]